jgi:two-component system, NarL family, response regulator DevR
MIRLVIADDSEILRKALRNFFASEPRFEIVGEAQDYAETIAIVIDRKPDVLLMDLRMPGIGSRGEIAKLSTTCRCPVIVMSFAADAEARSLAASTSAARLVDKAKLYKTLVPTIEAVLGERDPSTSH